MDFICWDIIMKIHYVLPWTCFQPDYHLVHQFSTEHCAAHNLNTIYIFWQDIFLRLCELICGLVRIGTMAEDEIVIKPSGPLFEYIWENESDGRHKRLMKAISTPWAQRENLALEQIDDDDPFALLKVERSEFRILPLPEKKVSINNFITLQDVSILIKRKLFFY